MDKVRFTPTHSAIIKLEPDKQITSRAVDSCLIGRIILDLPLNAYDVKCIASAQWKCKKDFNVSYIDRNIFMFSFQDKEDWGKVLLNVPWNFKGGLLILSPWTSDKIPDELLFGASPFWVQVHGLPLNYLTKENGFKIGQVLGKFLYLDGNVLDEKVLWRKFLRIRVILDITKPLLCGFWIGRAGLCDIWIEFKYEKLGIFCYKCGRIGNRYKTCKFPAGKGKFGPWLSAEPLNDPFSMAPSSSSGSGATVVDRATNTCTSLMIVAQPQAEEYMLNQSSGDLEPEGSEESEDGAIRELWRRLAVNGTDTMVLIVNCTVISNRVAGANPYDEGSWRLLMVMIAYFLYLVLKMVRVARRSCLNNLARTPNQQLSPMAFMEILILVIFLGILKSL